MDLGLVQAGWTMVHKVEEKGGFGLRNVQMNRHLVGKDWTSQACEPDEWETPEKEVVLVAGNPPCSLE